MKQEQSLIADQPGRCCEPTLEDRLIARMLARWLDAELARGVRDSFSEANAARAQQLTTKRTRRAVVRRLDRLVDRAQNPRPPLLIAPRSPCGEQVRDAMPQILTIRSRLLSREPLAALGIARLATLLRNHHGPFYGDGERDALTVALRDISELLDTGLTTRAASAPDSRAATYR